MSKMQRLKGQRGERDYLKKLTIAFSQKTIDIELYRNLQQTRGGGADCLMLKGAAIEIKYQKILKLSAWWRQAIHQAVDDLLPVLAYRQNRKPWTVLVPYDRCDGDVDKQVFRAKDLPDAAILTIDQFVEFYLKWN